MNDFLDFKSGEKGKCETNYFHIYVYSDINSDKITELDNVKKGTFMHEYLHYVQFIDTIFGLSYGIIYNNYFSYCRKYFSENNDIEIPLNTIKDYPCLKGILGKYKNIKGDNSDIPIEVERIIVSQEEISNAKENKSFVKVTLIETNTGKAYILNFGYLCIIESMAHIFQRFYDPDVEHSQIPYLSVELLVKFIFPEILEDKKLLYSICLCSLMFDNPGYGFFQILEIIKLNPRMNGIHLYKHMIDMKFVRPNKTQSMQEIFIDFIEDYKSNIQAAIAGDLEYFSDVFKNCKSEILSGENLILKLLYESDITSNESIDFILNFYGIPLVDFNDVTLMGAYSKNDIARLTALELVIGRMTSKADQCCPLFDKCNKSLYSDKQDPHFNMSEECRNNQWEKQDVCLMTESMKFLKVHGKNIITN
ncbi:MAG: hypothetical protein KBG33_07205 [Paludibacteraceae bacterium]|jgi:hypothetical protein|nr:hypothetical protein [Paludibacteraceae bacterium]